MGEYIGCILMNDIYVYKDILYTDSTYIRYMVHCIPRIFWVENRKPQDISPQFPNSQSRWEVPNSLAWTVATAAQTDCAPGQMSHLEDTLPETNIEPEKRPLEKEIPIGNHHFQVPC